MGDKKFIQFGKDDCDLIIYKKFSFCIKKKNIKAQKIKIIQHPTLPPKCRGSISSKNNRPERIIWEKYVV